MPSVVASAALAAAGVNLALAAPSKHHGHAFRFEQKANGGYIKSAPIAMMNAYNKYGHTGAKAPAGLAAAADSETGTVSANPENPNYDIAYTCSTQVGSSTLNLDFDTGSSDLWCFGQETPSDQSSGHNLYSPSSSGQEIQGASWSISYGDKSSAGGVVYSDTVAVGQATVTGQAVEVATQVAQQFIQNTAQDGLLGLGFSSGAHGNTVQPNRQQTFFENVGPSLQQNLFAVDLKKGAPGTYDFGYIDSSKYTGNINYVDIDGSNGYWEFQAGGYSVGNGGATGTIGDSIMDTGTSLLLLAGGAADAYYQSVPSAQQDPQTGIYTYDCSALPDFNVDIGDVTYNVPSDYLQYSKEGNGQCVGGIQELSGQLSIFGDIFMKHYFVVFDKTQGSPRMGIASQS